MEDEEATSRGGDSSRKRPAEEITANEKDGGEDPAAAPLDDEDGGGGGNRRSHQSRAAGAPFADASLSEERAALEESGVEGEEEAAAEMPEDEGGITMQGSPDLFGDPWVVREPEYVRVDMDQCRNNHILSRIAHALRFNEDAEGVCFEFGEMGIEEDLDWGALFRELAAARANLEGVAILNGFHSPARELPAFFNQVFRALQRNPNVRALGLRSLDLSAAGMISYLDAASNLTSLNLRSCKDSSAAHAFAKSLQRNTNLRSLRLLRCQNELVRQVFRSLSSPDSTSCVEKITYRPQYQSDIVAKPIQEYLESPTTTVQCFGLDTCDMWRWKRADVSDFVHGLMRSTSVNEMVFAGCEIENMDYDEGGDRNRTTAESIACCLAELFENKPNLSILRVLYSDFFRFEQFLDAVAKVLVQRNSPLRCVDLDLVQFYGLGAANEKFISVPGFRTLLKAIARSTRLERLFIRSLDPSRDGSYTVEYYQVLLDAIPLIRAIELHLELHTEFEERVAEDLLEAIKRNYNVQSVKCILAAEDAGEDEPWLDEACQARLDFYVDRNRKLAHWTLNPKLVPRELWVYAMELAMKAGINSLYRSLYELSGEGIGLKRNAGPTNASAESRHQ